MKKYLRFKIGTFTISLYRALQLTKIDIVFKKWSQPSSPLKEPKYRSICKKLQAMSNALHFREVDMNKSNRYQHTSTSCLPLHS